MIARRLLPVVAERLAEVPAVVRLSPQPERGFHAACADLAPLRRFLVYPGDDSYRLANDIQVTSLPALARLVAESASSAGA